MTEESNEVLWAEVKEFVLSYLTAEINHDESAKPAKLELMPDEELASLCFVAMATLELFNGYLAACAGVSRPYAWQSFCTWLNTASENDDGH